jgi:hypothetical protein
MRSPSSQSSATRHTRYYIPTRHPTLYSPLVTLSQLRRIQAKETQLREFNPFDSDEDVEEGLGYASSGYEQGRINELVAGMEEEAAAEEVRRREAAGKGAGRRLGGHKEMAAAAEAEMQVAEELDETWEIMDGQEIQVG